MNGQITIHHAILGIKGHPGGTRLVVASEQLLAHGALKIVVEILKMAQPVFAQICV